MKTKILHYIMTIFAMSIIFSSCTKTAAIPGNEIDPEAEKSALLDMVCKVEGDITETDAEGVLFMWEEEKMAKDVYEYFFDKYKFRVFGNIAKSEAIHQQAVNHLIEGYNLTNPGSDAPGVYTNEHIAELYVTLIDMGSTSAVNALNAGALIEETDILDLKNLLNETDNPYITRVYSNLLRASENHLRAFTGVMKIQGTIYEPVILNDDYYTAIISRQVSTSFREKGYNAGR
jgi:hypothetical protein